jgi:hypothetical protein
LHRVSAPGLLIGHRAARSPGSRTGSGWRSCPPPAA